MKIICNFDDEEQAERKKPYEKPGIIEVKKRNTGCRLDGLVKQRILELSEEGKNAKEIAEEMKMDYKQVKNFIYYERRKAGK